ncbi:MAG: cbb3-type cytochrome oxidase assembly protein CcoS [Alphaproteobacteria bacterium HGW-Alphaproteobacteria-6]|nr:MAG: cbb3-type cytochrome oxidase assembly protein CcoS [Alphaproteobacteria bacterium HGW-Alphaproteobacteria-6]
MSLLVLIPLSLGMGAVGLGAFFWALHHQQFDDPEGAAWRIIPAKRDRDAPLNPEE